MAIWDGGGKHSGRPAHRVQDAEPWLLFGSNAEHGHLQARCLEAHEEQAGLG